MNYKNLYDKIIANRQANPITEGYTERHHVIPRALAGSDEPDNLIALTPREHFICHYLLAKMYPRETNEWYKTNHAFMMMKAESYSHDRYYNSRLYEALRGNFSSLMSYAQKGKRNSQYGTRWIHSLEEKRSIKIGKDDPLPDGWNEGRKISFDTYTCNGCGETFERIKYERYCSKECKKTNYRTPTYNRYKGKSSNRWKGWWKTPSGVYETCAAAARAEGLNDETLRVRVHNPNFPDYELIIAT